MGKVTHGASTPPTPEYTAWTNMKQRCDNPNYPKYRYHGGRGIIIDPRWGDFKAFYDDMGPKPTPQHTLERKDNTKGYSKANCEWATMAAQGRNRRNTKLSLEVVREIRYMWATGRMTQRALAEVYGVTASMINQIVHKKWWKEGAL